MNKIGFLSLGLIGGSIALALRQIYPAAQIIAYARRQSTLDEALSAGAIDIGTTEINELFLDCDLIFLCAPVAVNNKFLAQLKPFLSDKTILTDVGSVKGSIHETISGLGLDNQFIGGHPMAGSEKTGYENSTDILLENAYYLLTPDHENRPEDIQTMQDFITEIGANCVVLPSEEHDRITAAISHVPHIIAVALVNMVRCNDSEEQNMKAFAAGGFKDITRIASSSPEMWQDICVANGKSIDHFLQYFQQQLEQFRHMIKEEDFSAINSEFRNAGDYRDSIPTRKSSIIARSYDLFVNIDDRTGAIATIATILSVNGISIKNIGIIHNREYADGVMKLELYKEEDAHTARRLLEQNRYDIVDRD